MTDTSPGKTLVRLITDYQRMFDLSDGVIAGELGIARTLWVALRSGTRQPTIAFAQKASRVERYREAATAMFLAPPSPARKERKAKRRRLAVA